MYSRFTLVVVAALVLRFASISAQDLAELARKERARRSAAGAVRYSIDNTTHPVESESNPSANASQSKSQAGIKARGQAPLEKKASTAAVRDKRLDDLARRGPVVWFELKKLNQRLAELEKELSELERTSTPTWRRGIRLENPELAGKRREIQTCRRRIQELDQEWKWLQDRARRLGLEPGVLRGSH